MIFAKTLLVAAAVASFASAQDIPGLTPCVLTCITGAASQNGCNGFADITCVCGNAQFQADANQCLKDHCTADELDGALKLQSGQCGAVSITPTGTAGPPKSVPFTTPTSTASQTTTSPASSHTTGAPSTSSSSNAPAKTSNAASGVSVPVVAGVVAAALAIGL